MPRHAELVADAVAAHHVACHAGNVERLAACLLYTSDAADERSSVDLGGRRIIKKKNSTMMLDHHEHSM